MATVLPPRGYSFRVPLGGIVMELLKRYDETKGRQRQIEDLGTVNQVLQQVQNDPEKQGYYISQALPRMRTEQGIKMMAGLMGPQSAEEEYMIGAPGSGIVGKRSGRIAGQIPIPKEKVRGEKQVVVRPGEIVWDPAANQEVYKHPESASRSKRITLSPNQVVVDAEGKEIARAGPAPEVEMTDREIGEKITKLTDLESEIVSGRVSDSVAILQEVNRMIGTPSQEMQDAAQKQDLNKIREYIRNERSYYEQLRFEKIRRKRFPNAKQDENGDWYITVKGRKKYLSWE